MEHESSDCTVRLELQIGSMYRANFECATGIMWATDPTEQKEEMG